MPKSHSLEPPQRRISRRAIGIESAGEAWVLLWHDSVLCYPAPSLALHQLSVQFFD